MNLKKGDNIKIMAGKDRGKTGTILRAIPEDNKVIIDGLNTVKKRRRPTKQGQSGETIAVPRPMPASKVMLICSSCKFPTRVGYRVEGAKKVRFCKKCNAST